METVRRHLLKEVDAVNTHTHTHVHTHKRLCTHTMHMVLWTCQPRPKQVDGCPFGMAFEGLWEFSLRFGKDSANI